MHSIRTKSIILNVVAMVTSIAITTAISVIYIAKLGHESSEQSLSLLCETGRNNINYYLKSVEQSVNTVSNLIVTPFIILQRNKEGRRTWDTQDQIGKDLED